MEMNQANVEHADEKLVAVPARILEMLIGMAESHVEDIDTGLADGTYDREENLDLDQKKAAIETANKALETAGQYLAVTGRIPGEDEDTTYIYVGLTHDEAIKRFDSDIYDGEVKPEEAREAALNEHGHTAFINSVLQSATPISEI